MLTLEDVAESAWFVVKHLGIDALHTVVGCSMGGMSGLAFCVRHPSRARIHLDFVGDPGVAVLDRGAFLAARDDSLRSEMEERQLRLW